MKLQEQLKKLNKKELITRAKQHNLYLNNDFSKAWIIKKIKDKLLTETYLHNLISNQLTKKSVTSIKEIIATKDLNHKKIKLSTLKELEDKLFAIKKEEQFILAEDLEKILSKILFNNTNISKLKSDSKEKLPFFFYVLLGTGKIKQLKNKANSNYKKEIYSFFSEINTSKFENDKFYNTIINYCKKAELIAENRLKLSKNFNYWLKKSYHQKILGLIKIFFPDYNKILRQIIAVLSKYPKKKTISNSFLINELNIQPFSQQKKELLEFFDILNFSKQKLQLSDFCWDIFTKNYEFIQPSISKNTVTVSHKTNLSLLWFIINNTSLIKIDKKLTFEIKDKNSFLKDFNNLVAK